MKPILNRKASYNYNLLEKLEAGVVLTGNEIKSIRSGKVSLNDAYVLVKADVVTLVNAHISPYEKGVISSIDPRRDRELLLHQKEIDYLIGKLSGSNLTIVPTKLYFKRNYAKIEIALAASKKKFDKREAIKRKELEREEQAVFREGKLAAQKETK